MNEWVWLQRWVLPACFVAMQVLSLMPAAAQDVRREYVNPTVTRDLATRRVVPSQTEAALARARAAMKAQDLATAHKEYRVAADSARGPGMEKLRAEAVRGFAESGVKLALQYKAQGKLPEAERIVREILSARYDPKYQPAVDLLPTLRPRAPTIRAFASSPPTPRTGETPEPRTPPSVPKDRRTLTAPPEPTPPPKEELPMVAAPPEPSPRATAAKAAKKPIVKVYFATDRRPSGNRGPSKYFGDEWNKTGEQLLTGFVNVSIPPVHHEGKVERPWKFFVIEFRENVKKHFVLSELHVSKGDDFYGDLRNEFDQRSTDDRSAFVFIHGYNVAFDEAAYSTAQIAYDLDFTGVPMMFSWPSQDRLGGYDGDTETIEFSSVNLHAFLARVARESGALRINLLAHSMGNRLLTRALEELARQPDIQPLFDNVIMAAPDVNARLFTDRIWPQIKIAAKRFTLYASSDDKALISSRKLRGGNDFTRLGEGGPNIVVIPGLDTVDASGIDTSLLGHSYVDSCRPVMQDLGLLLQKGFAPLQRKLRDRQNREGLGYWVFP